VHPWRARGVRLLVYGLPIALSFGFVHMVTALTSTPTGSLWLFLCWWLAVSLAATAVVSGVYMLTRRLLPLGALLELSLVFPDGAPSRFGVALRRGTVASLEERVRLLQEAKEASTTQQAAEILLQLVASLSDHDRITAGHADRVRGYSFALGKQLGLDDDELDRLNWAALLHDIGKLEVSPEILNQAGTPSEEEWKSLRLHRSTARHSLHPFASGSESGSRRSVSTTSAGTAPATARPGGTRDHSCGPDRRHRGRVRRDHVRALLQGAGERGGGEG